LKSADSTGGPIQPFVRATSRAAAGVGPPEISRRGRRGTGSRRTEHADWEIRKARAAIPRADFGPCDPGSPNQRWRPCAPDRCPSRKLLVGAGPAAHELRTLPRRAACLAELGRRGGTGGTRGRAARCGPSSCRWVPAYARATRCEASITEP
jgi:hypothetical protein